MRFLSLMWWVTTYASPRRSGTTTAPSLGPGRKEVQKHTNRLLVLIMAMSMMLPACVGEDEGSNPGDLTVLETEAETGNNGNNDQEGLEPDEECSNPLALCEVEEDDDLCGGQVCTDNQQCVDDDCECPADPVFRDDEVLLCESSSCTLFQDPDTCLWFCCRNIGRDDCLDTESGSDHHFFWRIQDSEAVADYCQGTMFLRE
jgi:hypothetical protein